MKFAQHTFTVSTSVTKDSDPIKTQITLTESDVDESIVAASATSGQSPRVRWQANFRENGVPTEKTMSWTEWFGTPPKSARVVQLSEAEMLHKAATDPIFRAKLLAELTKAQEVSGE